MNFSDIKTIPFDQIDRATFPETDKRVLANKHPKITPSFLKANSSWILPQLLAHLGSYKFHPDAKEFMRINAGNDARELGIWHLVARVNRSAITKTQTSKEMLPYCSLVPLHMAAQKKFNNVPYSAWNRDSLQYIMHPKLFEALNVEPIELSPDTILTLRDTGLRGRSPQTTFTLYGLGDTVLRSVNGYYIAMLTQIWCAHPANRNEYMILDPINLDNMPDPLIDVEMFTPPKHTTEDDNIAPWMKD